MKRKIGKMTIIAATLVLLIGVQEYSSEVFVFGESSTQVAYENMMEKDQSLKIMLENMPKDPILKKHVAEIIQAENEYQERIRNCWEMAESNYKSLPDNQKNEDKRCDKTLEIRNQLLRESHLADAKMLPLFKKLRNYLHENNMDKELVTLLEQHYESTKMWLIQHEVPQNRL